MKKRAMKKWIPKHSVYCDGCKWWRGYLPRRLNSCPQDGEELCSYAGEGSVCGESGKVRCQGCMIPVAGCAYLGIIDKKGDTLLWDRCKECGVKDEF